jgi:hypothetical protein
MGDTISVDEYLELDDIQLTYHIKRWAQDKDRVLADLAQRFLERRIFKATKIPVAVGAISNPLHDNGAGERRLKENKPLRGQIKEIEQEARKIASTAGFDPHTIITVRKRICPRRIL